MSVAAAVNPGFVVNKTAADSFLFFIGDDDGLGSNAFQIDNNPVLYGAFSEHIEALTEANRNGFSVYVKTRQKLIVSTNGTRTLKGVLQIANQLGLKPALINEVAPKEYDVFFNINADALDTSQFFDFEQQLATAFAGTREVGDRAHVPGFWNKGFQVCAVHVDANAPFYSAVEISASMPSNDNAAPPSPENDVGDNLKLPPLDQIDPTRRPPAIEDVCKQWLWVTGMKRFLNRADPTKQWDSVQFDSEFNCFLSRGQSISKELFREGKLLRKFHRPIFQPGGVEMQGTEYNLWRPSGIVPMKGDTSLWHAHLEWLFKKEADRDIILDWMSWVQQNPTRAPGYALLLVGNTFGTGKSFIARVMEYITGKTNTQRPKNSSIRGDFNPWAALCRLAIIEELNQIGRTEVAHELRDMITEPTIEVNPKGINPYKIANYIAMMAISNEPNALPIQPGDRRWAVVETNITQEEKQVAVDSDYFKRLMPMVDPLKPDTAALAAIAYELQTRVIRKFTPGDAPSSAAKLTMIEMSLSPLDKWLTDNVKNDPLTRQIINVRDDIIEILPSDLKITKNLDTSIQRFLKSKLDGVSIGDHRVNKKVTKLWAINKTGRTTKAAIAGGAKPREALGDIDVGATVEKSRTTAAKNADTTAQEDFSGS